MIGFVFSPDPDFNVKSVLLVADEIGCWLFSSAKVFTLINGIIIIPTVHVAKNFFHIFSYIFIIFK